MEKEIRDKNGLTEKEFLAQYKAGDFIRPSVATDIVIFTVMEQEEKNYRKLPKKEWKVLLIQRGEHPYLNCWALPGGFIRPTETAEMTAERELREETGVSDVYLEQLHLFTEPYRDPRTWVMSCAYMALIDGKKVNLQAGDDASNAEWFSIEYQKIAEKKEKQANLWIETDSFRLILKKEEEILQAEIERKRIKRGADYRIEYQLLSNEGLAFDHAKIIALAIERLREKVEETDIVLNLMSEQFTLTELQQVHEIILGHELLKPAFRRKITGMLEETENFTENAGHRPSRFYKRKTEFYEKKTKER